MEKLQFREVKKPSECEGMLSETISCSTETKKAIRDISNKSDIPIGKVAERLLRFGLENIEWI